MSSLWKQCPGNISTSWENLIFDLEWMNCMIISVLVKFVREEDERDRDSKCKLTNVFLYISMRTFFLVLERRKTSRYDMLIIKRNNKPHRPQRTLKWSPILHWEKRCKKPSSLSQAIPCHQGTSKPLLQTNGEVLWQQRSYWAPAIFHAKFYLKRYLHNREAPSSGA